MMARRIRRLSDLEGYPMVVHTFVIKNHDHKDSVPKFVDRGIWRDGM